MKIDWILCQTFLENHPRDAAVILEKYPPEDTAGLLQKLPEQKAAAKILEYINTAIGARCIALWQSENISGILSALSIHRIVMFLRYMDEEARNRLIANAPADISDTIPILLHYPENTAGSLMDPHVFTLAEDNSIAEARKRIRRFMKDKMHYLYVVDREHRLTGILNYRDLMLASKEELVSTIMARTVARIPARARIETIIKHPDWGRFNSLPVLDEGNILLGVLHYETVRQREQVIMMTDRSDPVSTAVKIGEIYWISVLALLGNMITILKPDSNK